MATFKLNPLAVNFQLTITGISIEAIEKAGFDFSQYHENYAEAKEISVLEAIQHHQENNYCKLFVSGEGTPIVHDVWADLQGNKIGDSEPSGDSEESIQSIVRMLNAGNIEIAESEDYTTDADGNYCPTFITE